MGGRSEQGASSVRERLSGRAYPDAKLYGAPGLPEKRDLKFDGVLSDIAPNQWSQDPSSIFSRRDVLNEVLFFINRRAR